MRFLIRTIGFLCVAGGFVALVADGARALANGAFEPMAFGELIALAFPKAFPLIEPAVKAHAWSFIWDPVLVWLFASPAYAVGLVVGFVLMLLARPRRAPIGYPTR